MDVVDAGAWGGHYYPGWWWSFDGCVGNFIFKDMENGRHWFEGKVRSFFIKEKTDWSGEGGDWTRRESNTQPSDLESDALPLRHGSLDNKYFLQINIIKLTLRKHERLIVVVIIIRVCYFIQLSELLKIASRSINGRRKGYQGVWRSHRFVRKVEMHSNEKVSKDFLMTLRAYRNGCKDLVDAYRGVVGLVAGYLIC